MLNKKTGNTMTNVFQYIALRKLQFFQLCLLLFLLVIAGYLYLTFPHAVLDDAYIYARYAHNLAVHGDFVWNLDGTPVNGCTGILLPILYSIFFKFGIGFETQCLIIGLTSFILTGFLIWKVLFTNRTNIFISISVFSLYLFSPVLYWNIFSGLETFLFTFFLVLSAYLFQKAILNPKKWNIPVQLALLGLVLSRPEGVVFAVLFNFAILIKGRDKKFRWRLIVEASLFLIIPYLTYFTWQWLKFGFPLPNSYYVKSSLQFNESALAEIIAFITGNSNILASVSLLVACTVLVVMNRKRTQKYDHDRSVFFTVAVSTLGTCIVMGKYMFSLLQMNISDRFFVPFFVLMIFSIGLLISEVTHRSEKNIAYKIVCFIAMVICLISIGLNFSGIYFSEKRYAKKYMNTMQSEHIPAGMLLNQEIPPNEYIVVVIDAGAIPFYSELPAIDFGRLNDSYLTHNKLSNEERLDYLFSKNPGAIVITGSTVLSDENNETGAFTDFPKLIVEDSRFSNYHIERIYGQDESLDKLTNYLVFVYIRNDLN
jgi:arabinofuranosyltransferase